MLDKILKRLELSDKESAVYLALLRLGSERIHAIAKRVGLSRSTTYNILHSLFKKGLVRRFDKGVIQYFVPIPPKELIDVLERKKDELDNKIILVKTYLPQLEALCHPAIALPKVSFFEGMNGIKQIYHDILRKGDKKTFAALSMDNIAPELKEWMIRHFTPKKVKKNIASQVLVSSRHPKSYVKLDKKHLRKSLVVSNKKYPFEVEIDVYDGNKTAFISFDESEMIGVIIESSKIANTLRSLFALVWDRS